MLCQSDLILLHKWGLDDSQSHTTVDSKLCKLATFQPFDLKEHTVAHLKDFIHIYLEQDAQGISMTFYVFFSRSKYPQIIA